MVNTAVSHKDKKQAINLEFDFRTTKPKATDLAQLRPFELVRLILQKNPAFIGARHIAVIMEVDISTVYRWSENPKTNGIEISFENIIKFARATHTENLFISYFNARTKR